MLISFSFKGGPEDLDILRSALRDAIDLQNGIRMTPGNRNISPKDRYEASTLCKSYAKMLDKLNGKGV